MSPVLQATTASVRDAEPGEVATLEALVAEIFGAGDRPRGWFERKLAREVVAPALSKIAVDPRGAKVGFLLASAPESLSGVARLVSLGVLPTWRGHGIGRALIEAAATSATAAGLSSMTALAEADRRGFYADTGFYPEEVLRTLLAPNKSPVHPAPEGDRDPDVLSGSGAASPESTAGATEPADHEVMTVRRHSPASWSRAGTQAVGGWLAEAWEGTPAPLRQTYALGGDDPLAWAHVSREGEAQLIHRLLLRSPSAPRAPQDVAAAVFEIAQALARRLAPGGPLLFYGLPAVSPITDLLEGAGWSCVQESTRMVRRLRSRATDGGAPP